uniref:DUF4198 domain-containing protein n=1 Tax=candidate division WOR-3 bacterium TaxID=2052148 RepID=A0A7C4CA52_UNCW3
MRKQLRAFASASVTVLAILVLAAPLLAAGNNKPCLSGAKITPTQGGARSVYVATISYNDPDGDAAAKVEVYVDGVAYPMRRVGGTLAKGTWRARLTLPPGRHEHYFAAEDARGASERYPRYGARPGPYVGSSNKVYNRLPELTNGGCYVGDGSDRAVYTFTVDYLDKDGRRPKSVKVFVDGIPHLMTLHKGSPAAGTYIYQTRLAAGRHAYYFVAADECGGCVTHPAYGFLRGPDVEERLNSAPVLVGEKLMPAMGYQPNLYTALTDLACSNTYTYLVEYRDPDYDPPSLALIYINDKPHKMTLATGKPCGGEYMYRTRLYPGAYHKYYFYFEDGRGNATRLPPNGYFHGPVVVR